MKSPIGFEDYCACTVVAVRGPTNITKVLGAVVPTQNVRTTEMAVFVRAFNLSIKLKAVKSIMSRFKTTKTLNPKVLNTDHLTKMCTKCKNQMIIILLLARLETND